MSVTFEVLLSSPCVDLVSGLHKEHCLVNQVVGDTCLYSYVLGMQIHMASLDAFNTQRSKSCKVLSKANRDDHLAQLYSRGVIHYLVSSACGRVGGDGATLCTYRERNLKLSFEGVTVDLVSSQRSISTT